MRQHRARTSRYPRREYHRPPGMVHGPRDRGSYPGCFQFQEQHQDRSQQSPLLFQRVRRWVEDLLHLAPCPFLQPTELQVHSVNQWMELSQSDLHAGISEHSFETSDRVLTIMKYRSCQHGIHTSFQCIYQMLRIRCSPGGNHWNRHCLTHGA